MLDTIRASNCKQPYSFSRFRYSPLPSVPWGRGQTPSFGKNCDFN